MTSHREPIRHPHHLCDLCRQREATYQMNRTRKSRKAKRRGRYTNQAHDLCGPCWRGLCAAYWVHVGVPA